MLRWVRGKAGLYCGSLGRMNGDNGTPERQMAREHISLYEQIIREKQERREQRRERIRNLIRRFLFMG